MLTAQVSSQQRLSDERPHSSRDGPGEGLVRSRGVSALVAVAGRGGEELPPSFVESQSRDSESDSFTRSRRRCPTPSVLLSCILVKKKNNNNSNSSSSSSSSSNININTNITSNTESLPTAEARTNNQSGASRTREQKPQHNSTIIDHPLFLLSSDLHCRLRHSQHPLAFFLPSWSSGDHP